MSQHYRSARRIASFLLVTGTLAASAVIAAAPAQAAYATITGSGSSWAANAVYNWTANGKKFGWTVNYTASGSSRGRTDFLTSQVDFAVSDIPFQAHPTDGSNPENPTPGSYAYMPIVAGGTSFMYNLTVGGKRLTNLRLSGQNIARIFTGQATLWNDPAIAADNPGVALPALRIVPVTRADGSGSSAQFSLWMQNQYPDIWKTAYPPGGETSIWPNPGNKFQPKSGDDGVANYISAPYGAGAIGYVQYSYAKNKGFPVAKMLNKANYYVEPTPQNVAVALLKAQIETANHDPAVYLTQQLNGVYNDTDPRTYPMSSYSYMILPITQTARYSADKASTLGAFGKYLLCDGQGSMAQLGYSPLPLNLVQAGFDQLKLSPGVNVGDLAVSSCTNPTFSTDGTNQLAKTAPFPSECDKLGVTQCGTSAGSSGGGSGSGGGSAAGAGGGTSATTGAASDNGTAAVVDPEQGGGGNNAAGATVPLAGPVALNESTDSGWSGAQTFAVLAGALLLLVFLAPPLLMKRLGRDDDDGKDRS